MAALWTWFLARVNHLALPATSVVAMAVAVWLLYAADRLLDARSIESHGSDALEERHRFHHRHRSRFLMGIAAASVVLALLVPRLPPASIHLYLIEGSFLASYFVVIHATSKAHRLPKELAVGLFFSAAVFIPTVAPRPDLRAPLLSSALLLAALCSQNCLFIYAWEHAAPGPAIHWMTRFALRHLRALTAVAGLVALALWLLGSHAPSAIYWALALSAGILLVLDLAGSALTPTTRRAAADLALLTPVLFLWTL